MLKLVCGVFLICFATIEGHKFHLGDCPDVKPMLNFDMKQFLGVWHVVQKTSSGNTCKVINITETDEPFQYGMVETSQNFALRFLGLKHEIKYETKLTIKKPAELASMEIKYMLDGLHANFTILNTDYNQYALVYECRKFGFFHRQSAMILSRSNSLDASIVTDLRVILLGNSINPFELSRVSQQACPVKTSDTTVIQLDQESIKNKLFDHLRGTVLDSNKMM